MRKHSLGAVQLEIMKLLWEHGKLTAREITDSVGAKQNLAHSTIQSLLRKLETKGAIRHEEAGRVFVFFPIWREDEATTGAARDLLTRVFGGSIYGLVSNLLKTEKIDPAEMARLRELIDKTADEDPQDSEGKAAQ